MAPGVRIRHLIATAWLVLALVSPADAAVELPAPGDRSIHDFAGVLAPEEVAALEARHRELFQKTEVAIVVVLVKTAEQEPLSDFAVRVGKEWGVGRKGKDRGIVVAITTEEPHIFVATGYGVEGYLPDGRVGGILDTHVVEPLRRRDFNAAVQNASAGLVQATAEEYGVSIGATPATPSRAPRSQRTSTAGIIFRILLGLLVLFIVMRNPSLFWLLLLSGRGGGGRSHGGGFGGGGFGGDGGFGGFGGGGFGGGGAGR